MKGSEWRQYQADAAAVFAELGCTASVDATVRGVRASHKVDVHVQFTRFGLDQLWIVECKHQGRRVTKAAVEALKSIVLDVGAAKGFLLSEAGFQPAALAAASTTNVSLLSLATLKAKAAEDLTAQSLSQLETEVVRLMRLIGSLQIEVERGQHTTVYRSKPGVGHPGVLAALGSLVALQRALQEARIGQYGHAIPAAFRGDLRGVVVLMDSGQLHREGSRLVGEVDTWYSEQGQRIERALRRLGRAGASRVV